MSCFVVLVITGESRSGVLGARSRMQVIAESYRQKIPFTHFLSFPLYKNDLVKKMEEFKTKVLEDCSEVEYLHMMWSISQKSNV